MPLKGSASEDCQSKPLQASDEQETLHIRRMDVFLYNDYYMQLLSASSVLNTSLRTLHVFM